jgi:hypothetical protein
MGSLIVRLGPGCRVGSRGRGGFRHRVGEEDAGELVVDLIEKLLNPGSRHQRHAAHSLSVSSHQVESAALTSGPHASLLRASRDRRRASHPSGTAYRALRPH